MRLKNYTDIPTEQIRELIRVVRPAGISNFDVRVSNTPVGVRGRAYTRGSGYHDRPCPFIVVSVARTNYLVRSFHPPKNGYLPIFWGNRMEALLVVLAHELRHLWQAAGSGKRRGMVYGARGRMSERDADAYALRMLRKYRRGELV